VQHHHTSEEMSEEKVTTQVADDDAEARIQSQLRRISQLEQENTTLKEVNDILQKAVAYYAPVSARLFERGPLPLRD
jgi:hypothetical protein